MSEWIDVLDRANHTGIALPVADGGTGASDAATARTNLGIAPLSGAGAPGVSTGNGRILGTIYIDTTADLGYTLADATTDANVWSAGGGTTILTGTVDPTTEGSDGDFYYNTVERGYWYKDTGTWEQVGVVADDVTIEVDPTNGLQIKDAGVIATTKLSATGTKDATTFLRGDNTWAAPATGSSLDGLSDVTLTTPATDAVLIKSAGDWIDGTINTDSITDDAVTLAKIDAHTGAVAGVLGYGASGDPAEVSASSTVGHVMKSAGTAAAPVFGQLVAASYGDGTIAVSRLADGTDGELITWGAAGTATTVAAGTATHVLTSNGPGAAPTFQAAPGAPTLSRSITIEDPGTAEDITMFFTPVAITITDIRSLTIGGTSTVNFDLYESAFATRATTTAINGSSMTADTNGNTDTTFTNAGVAANSWVSLKTTTGGTAGATELHVTVVYTED